jgi:hypothetical protein
MNRRRRFLFLQNIHLRFRAPDIALAASPGGAYILRPSSFATDWRRR